MLKEKMAKWKADVIINHQVLHSFISRTSVENMKEEIENMIALVEERL